MATRVLRSQKEPIPSVATSNLRRQQEAKTRCANERPAESAGAKTWQPGQDTLCQPATCGTNRSQGTLSQLANCGNTMSQDTVTRPRHFVPSGELQNQPELRHGNQAKTLCANQRPGASGPTSDLRNQQELRHGKQTGEVHNSIITRRFRHSLGGLRKQQQTTLQSIACLGQQRLATWRPPSRRPSEAEASLSELQRHR